MRDKAWQKLTHDKLITSLTSKTWRDMMEGALAIMALGLLFQGAEAIGMLEAGSRVVLEGDDKQDSGRNAKHKRDVGQVRNATQTATAQVREKTAAQIRSRQREYLQSLPKTLLKGSNNNSIVNIAKQFNREFIRKVNSKEMLDKYPNVVMDSRSPMSWFNTKRLMREAGDRLHKHPLPLPNMLQLAYFVGVGVGNDDPPPPKKGTNKGQHDPPPPGGDQATVPGSANKAAQAAPHERKSPVAVDVLHPARFLEEKTGRDNRKVVGEHTAAVANFLEGSIKEADLPKSAAGLPPSELRQSHQLIAMFLGYMFSDWKVKRGSSAGFVAEQFRNDGEKLFERLYGAPKPKKFKLAKDLAELFGKKCHWWTTYSTECRGGLEADDYIKAKEACGRFWSPHLAECMWSDECFKVRGEPVCGTEWVGGTASLLVEQLPIYP